VSVSPQIWVEAGDAADDPQLCNQCGHATIINAPILGITDHGVLDLGQYNGCVECNKGDR
jgi:hypothetical protein